MKLTKSQRRVLRQAYQSPYGGKSCMRSVANQLVARGLAFISSGTHDRQEWQRTVSSLPIVVLTDAGDAVAKQLIEDLA